VVPKMISVPSALLRASAVLLMVVGVAILVM